MRSNISVLWVAPESWSKYTTDVEKYNFQGGEHCNAKVEIYLVGQKGARNKIKIVPMETTYILNFIILSET